MPLQRCNAIVLCLFLSTCAIRCISTICVMCIVIELCGRRHAEPHHECIQQGAGRNQRGQGQAHLSRVLIRPWQGEQRWRNESRVRQAARCGGRGIRARARRRMNSKCGSIMLSVHIWGMVLFMFSFLIVFVEHKTTD